MLIAKQGVGGVATQLVVERRAQENYVYRLNPVTSVQLTMMIGIFVQVEAIHPFERQQHAPRVTHLYTTGWGQPTSGNRFVS